MNTSKIPPVFAQTINGGTKRVVRRHPAGRIRRPTAPLAEFSTWRRGAYEAEG